MTKQRERTREKTQRETERIASDASLTELRTRSTRWRCAAERARDSTTRRSIRKARSANSQRGDKAAVAAAAMLGRGRKLGGTWKTEWEGKGKMKGK